MMTANRSNAQAAELATERPAESEAVVKPWRGFKRPESVLVLVYTNRGEVLMLERREPAGFWQSVTGSLEWQESPRRAAERELFEETGLQAGNSLVDLRHTERFRIVSPWRTRYARKDRVNTEHWFALRLEGRRLIRLRPDEHRRYRWLPARQAARLAFSWTNRRAIERYVGV
jgi:dATP pyrophosphohydrolase